MEISISIYQTLKKGERAPVHATKAYGGNKSIAPLILNLGTGRRSVINTAPWPLYPGKEPRCPLKMRLAEPQRRSEGVCEPLYLSYEALIMFTQATVNAESKRIG
jgi:hypothetical protein